MAIFNATFGFGPEERKRGIVDLARLEGAHRPRTRHASLRQR